jgi:diacylglycerol kinase family enzyme
MNHLFVINPRSFPVQAARERVLREIRGVFAARGEKYSIHTSRYPRDAIGYIRKKAARSDGALRVYAVGGDGIIFDCLNGIVGLDGAELACVPYGNANDFVRSFGEGRKALFQDIALQASSPVIPADIIRCGNNYALNVCTVGIESDTLVNVLSSYERIARRVRRYRGLTAAIYALLFVVFGIKAVFTKRLLNQYYTITIDGKDFSGVYGSINIANGPCYGGNKNPVLSAVPDDGFLDALFFRCRDSFEAARLLQSYVRGEYRRFPRHFTWRRFKKMEIRSLGPLLVDLDGETFFDTNITVEIIPGGIPFAAPGGLVYERRDRAGPGAAAKG